ncbi:MAG: EamA family transporter [Firmicutes bacterium]|nr:EamA family transporter [Bacillota bacterium]
MSIYMFWPILLAVFSDIFYQISAKSTPETLNPFASLTVTYLIGSAVSAILFFVMNPGQSILTEWKSLNWAAFVLGVAIVGLEVGSIYMYKVGWAVNTGYIVKAGLLSVALIAVGYFLYKEDFTTTKAVGIAACLLGLYLINK